jgi:hypothetical protein
MGGLGGAVLSGGMLLQAPNLGPRVRQPID